MHRDFRWVALTQAGCDSCKRGCAMGDVFSTRHQRKLSSIALGSGAPREIWEGHGSSTLQAT